jgi:hypothetical protein
MIVRPLFLICNPSEVIVPTQSSRSSTELLRHFEARVERYVEAVDKFAQSGSDEDLRSVRLAREQTDEIRLAVVRIARLRAAADSSNKLLAWEGGGGGFSGGGASSSW